MWHWLCSSAPPYELADQLGRAHAASHFQPNMQELLAISVAYEVVLVAVVDQVREVGEGGMFNPFLAHPVHRLLDVHRALPFQQFSLPFTVLQEPELAVGTSMSEAQYTWRSNRCVDECGDVLVSMTSLCPRREGTFMQCL